MKLLHLFFLGLILLTSFNCKEEPSQSGNNNNPQTKDAVLRWQGAYEVDGCGFFVTIDNKTYKPENENEISSDFMKNEDMNVRITFTFSDHKIEYNCGDLPNKQTADGIKIISMTRV